MKVTDEGVPVETLISVVKDSIKRAGMSRTSQDRDLQVTSVQLILDVVAGQNGRRRAGLPRPFIGMKLRVGGKVTSKDTHTIDITLVPPEERAPGRCAAAMLGCPRERDRHGSRRGGGGRGRR